MTAGPFREAFESRILPALRNFSPDMILISAGFDAHEADPLASMRLKEIGFCLGQQVKIAEVAHKQCDGRMVSLLEGGYDLEALGRSVGVHVEMLMQSGKLED